MKNLLKPKSLLIFFLFVSTTHLFAQERTFNFGASSGVIFSQIEGDNLRGFKKLGYNFSLLGGFKINSKSEVIVTTSFENLGSKRKGESTSRFTDEYLAEVDLDQVGLSIAYSRNFAEDWDGKSHYRYFGGLKLNSLIDKKGRLSSSSIILSPQLTDNNFRSFYASFKLGVGLIIAEQWILDLNYEHALQNIYVKRDELNINKLVPFHLSMTLSYYIYR